MSYDPKYYQDLKQKIQDKYTKAQQKWLSLGELYCKEYIEFMTRVQELNAELQELQAKEKESIEAEKKTPVKESETK
jgi:hypothetical protein